jgi:hypothetical protein
MDAGSGLMFLACVAIEKRRNQSNSSTLDVVMAAVPSILRDTDILRVSKDTLLKLQNRQTLLYNAFNSVYTNEINILR